MKNELHKRMTSIIQLNPVDSEKACRAITATLPDWFGIPEVNERYAQGVKERLCLGFVVDGKCLGMISLEFPFSGACTIYWMAVKIEAHGKGVGTALLRYAEQICLERGAYSLTVETLSPKENNRSYAQTFDFYYKNGFRPLFELHTYSPEYAMVYLNKVLSSKMFTWIDLTHELSEKIPTWNGDCGFRHKDMVRYEECTGDCKFLVQRIDMLAGIGTHIDAPSHCFHNGKTINEIPLESLISPCVVIDVSKDADEQYSVAMPAIEEFEKTYGSIGKDAFVIFHTGWGRFWDQPEKYHNNYRFPSITKQVAEYLITKDIAGIGIDTLSPDRPESGFPVHQAVLGAGKYIVENVANASLMPASGGYSFALPIKTSCTEAPIRLLGMVTNEV